MKTFSEKLLELRRRRGCPRTAADQLGKPGSPSANGKAARRFRSFPNSSPVGAVSPSVWINLVKDRLEARNSRQGSPFHGEAGEGR